MTSTDDHTGRVILLGAGEGRTYPCGPMTAVFKADGPETGDRYSISEWTLAPASAGPGAHTHEANDDIFVVLAGVVTFELSGERHEVATGGFVRVPAGVEHDYWNDGSDPARLLNVYIPGGFEADMPAIVQWFAEHA